MDHYVDMAADMDDTWLPTWTTCGSLHGRHVAAYVEDTWLPTWTTRGCLRGGHMASYVDDTWLPTWTMTRMLTWTFLAVTCHADMEFYLSWTNGPNL
jgi:hypothetical protein